jgi:integrase
VRRFVRLVPPKGVPRREVVIVSRRSSKRRSRNDGGVRQRKDKRWEGTVELGYRDGKRLRKSVYGRTKQEALDQLREEQARIRSGLAPTNGRQTTGQFLRWWYDGILKGTVSEGTYQVYGSLLRLYLIPSVGHVRLAQLAPSDVTLLMGAMGRGELSRNRRPLSAQTQSAARKLLSRALRTAQFEGLVTRNVAAIAPGPRVERREGRSLTADQARTLLEAIKGERLGAAIALQLTVGLRKGEVLGLRWEDLSLEQTAPVAQIRQQLQRRPRIGLVLCDLKTRSSRRDLQIPLKVAMMLREWRRLQSKEHLSLGGQWGDAYGLVFTTPTGTPIDPANYSRRVHTITERSGIGSWRTHELRHSTGSLLFELDVPMKLITELLGHSSERFTSDHYVHTTRESRTLVADTMSAALWGADSSSSAGVE